MKKVKVILIGAGLRGMGYAKIMAAQKEKFQIVAVAEPIESRRNFIKDLFDIPEEMCFDDYKPLLALGKIADIAVIANQDRQHFEPSMTAISLKYDLLLEKPIAPTPEECTKLAKYANEMGSRVIICHVLRFTPFFVTLKNIIDSGKIGKIMNIHHMESVGNVHHSHSFTRGNWGNSERSSTMLLQKTCHDMDILQWIIGKKCKKVSSFGKLTHFTEANAPEGSAERCMDCKYQDSCRFSAKKLYLESEDTGWFRAACAQKVDPTDEDILEALNTTQYGKCVYKCDNDVVDHQVVNLEFEDDILCTFTMSSFGESGRYINVMGTEGNINVKMEDASEKIPVYIFDDWKTEYVDVVQDELGMGSHSGGDTGIISTLYDYITGTYDGKSVCTIEQSKDNHMIVFAAEKARETGTVVDFDEFVKNYQ